MSVGIDDYMPEEINLRTLEHPLKITSVPLPNGMIVSCLQRHEVAIVNREVQGYFSNGLRLKPGDTVFDVGANIGLFTLAAYERCERILRAYAFEPVRAIFDVLSANVGRLASTGQLKVFAFGLSSSAETVRFAYYPRAPGALYRLSRPAGSHRGNEGSHFKQHHAPR